MSVRLNVRRAADVYKDIARVPESHRNDPSGRLIPEGEVCRLFVSRRSTYALLRGKVDSSEAAIWLDERTRNRLDVTPGQEVDFELRLRMSEVQGTVENGRNPASNPPSPPLSEQLA